MIERWLLAFAVGVPVAGSCLLPAIGWVSPRARNAAAFLLVGASLAASACLVPAALAGRAVGLSRVLPTGLTISFAADGLAVFMALVSGLVGLIIVLYSFSYISRYPNQDEYYFMVVLFLGSMMGLVYSANLILIYVFWEVTAIASWRLIGFYRSPVDVMRADKAFLVTVTGALAMLIGFLILYQRAGSFELAAIKAALGADPVPAIAVALILTGILTKSATLPFHTWLPDAGVAPSPVTALLHAAVLVKIGVYVYARFFVATFPIDIAWHTVIPWIAAASALVSAGAALVETDLKRIIAYSTVSQIAFILLGFAIGNGVGAAGAVLYILMHGLSKGGLFLCAGVVEQNLKTKDIGRMGGLIATMPVTAVSFFACSLSVMGVPPFGGFFSKYLVMAGAATAEHFALTFTFLAGALLTIAYLLRVFNAVFLGEPRTAPAGEGSRLMVACVALLAVLSLLSGIFITYPSAFAQAAIRQIGGG